MIVDARRQADTPPGPEVDRYPLSFLQEGMLFHTLASDEPGVDITQVVCEIDHELDPARLLAAWQALIARHALMRTSFVWEGLDEPAQRVHATATLPVRVLDWRSAEEPERSGWFDEFLAKDRARGFDLTHAPLMRLTLIRWGAESWRMVWTMHHILMDGRAFILALTELFERLEGTPPAGEATSYRDYVRFLREQPVEPAEAYWTALLEGIETPTRLSVVRERQRGAAMAGTYAGLAHRFDAEATAALERLASQHGLTMNTLVQGAWAILLSRYACGEGGDVVFGTTRAGRAATIPGADRLVGLCINTVPVRARVNDDARLVDWLRGLRVQHVAVREAERVSLVQVQRWSGLPADQPLFDTLVVFNRRSLEEALRGRGGDWQRRRCYPIGHTNVPLAVVAYGGPELVLRLDHRPDLFDEGVIPRILDHLVRLLGSFATMPEARLGELPMLSDDERAWLIDGCNETAAYRPRCALPVLLAEQVAAAPDAVAVVAGELELTYAEMARRADLVARALCGMEARGPVGLFCERVPAFAVGVWGILGAGLPFLPLDADYPPERLRGMLEDAGVGAVVATRSLAGRLPFDGAVLQIDEDGQVANGAHIVQASAPETLDPSSPAYVMYTSGTTGEPKGIIVTHAGVANFALSMARTFEMTPADRMLQFASPSFDIAIEEMFTTWVSGATLVLRRPDMHRSIDRFLEGVRELDITVVDLPTAFWHQWVSALGAESTMPEALRLVVVGGEKASAAALADWQMRGGVRWINTYGPTETTVVATTYEPPGAHDAAQELPIGRPIDNTRCYVLDGRGEPVPQGVPGELWIGGAGVAAGYIGRHEETARAFVDDPFQGGPRARMYRSGDLVRRRADGLLDFVGRRDQQVKIRGFRVEPDEVAGALERLPAVRSAAVIAERDRTGAYRLLAFVVGPECEPEALREGLRRALPAYMIPARIAVVERLPQTARGKLDRAQLLLSLPAATRPRREPTTPTQQHLARIWSELLDIREIGLDDNFFDLGGHSLLTIQLIDRAQRIGLTISFQQLLSHPTLGALADCLDHPSNGSATPLVPLRARGSTPPLFLVHTTPGDLLGYGHLVHHLGDRIPCYGFRAQGLLDPENAHERIEDMASCYVELLESVQPDGPVHLAGWCYGGIVAGEMASQLRAAGREVALLGLIDAPAMGASRAHRLCCLMRMGPLGWLRYGWAKLRRRAASSGELLAQELEEGPLANRAHVMRTNSRAVRRYTAKRYDGPIQLITASRTKASQIHDPTLGWGPMAKDLTITRVDAEHETLLQHEAAKEIAGVLRAQMLGSEV